MSFTRKNYTKILPILVMVMILALAIAPATVSAQDAAEGGSQLEDDGDVADDGDLDEDGVEAEESTFKSPNDVKNLEQKTANILGAIDSELADLQADLEAKEAALGDLNPEDDGYDDALAARDDAQAALEKGLAELSGVDADTISQMREDGYGYGQICHELGVHPSVLGNRYGQQKMSQYNAQARNSFGKKGEISAATSRDVKTGWANGHGKSVSGKSNGKGKSDSLDSEISGKSKGKSGNAGKGNGKGGGNGKK
ncbi:MAG: hypothetical protein HF981_05075 [Desulfobacteraceae bacterium]|nr:hypothetical protein [Desulfobacteraceae bacterium]MBC2749738.1 hypothetical protein [Desulfobacteraceae bacterium]